MLCAPSRVSDRCCVVLQGHDSHQLAKPDTSFISTLRKSHPGCTVAVLTDQATQIALPEGVRLFRHTIDRSKLGRNAYANYYQYLAQVRRHITQHLLPDRATTLFVCKAILALLPGCCDCPLFHAH